MPRRKKKVKCDYALPVYQHAVEDVKIASVPAVAQYVLAFITDYAIIVKGSKQSNGKCWNKSFLSFSLGVHSYCRRQRYLKAFKSKH